jgi:hypothetical protein
MKPTDAELSAFISERLERVNEDFTKTDALIDILRDAIDFFSGSPKETIAWLELHADAATPYPYPDGKHKTIIPCPEREVFDNLKKSAQLIKRLSENSASNIHPVHVNEKPWKRPGWCDKDGKCWMSSVNLVNARSVYTLIYSNYKWAEKYPNLYTHLLPYYTINIPKS